RYRALPTSSRSRLGSAATGAASSCPRFLCMLNLSRPVRALLRQPLLQHLFEHHCLVMPLIARRVHQRERPLSSRLDERPQLVSPRRELLTIAPLKFLPARGIMAKPLPELIARRHLPHPPINLDLLLPDPPRPHPIHQEPSPIVRSSSLIRAFD